MSGEVPLARMFERPIGGSWGQDPDSEGVEVVATCLRGTDFDFRTLSAKSDSAPLRGFGAAEYASRVTRAGDLVIEKSGGGEKTPVGRSVLVSESDPPMIPTNFAARLRPTALARSRFLAYLLTSLYNAGWTRATLNQTTGIQNLDLSAFLRWRMPLPSLEEQAEIERFLDFEVEQIDLLINEYRHQISLAEVEWHAELDSILLRGQVESDERGTPTGISGVAMVPLWAVASVRGGVTVDSKRKLGPDAVDVAYLRVANVQDGFLDLDEIKEIRLPPDVVSRNLLAPGDVLLTEGGDPDKLGRGTVFDGEPSPCVHQNHVFSVRPSDGLLPQYLALITRCSYGKAYFEATGVQTTGIATTNKTKVKSFRIPETSLEGQRLAVEACSNATVASTNLRAALNEQIRHLDEYRTALISTAVFEGVAACKVN